MAAIDDLRAQRGDLVKAHQELLDRATSLLEDPEGKALELTEEGAKEFEALEGEIKAKSAEIDALDARIATMERIAAERAKAATPALAPVVTPAAPLTGNPATPTETRAYPEVSPERPKVEKGILGARVIRCFAFAKANGYSVSELPNLMKARFGNPWLANEIHKQLNTGTGSEGGFLVPTVLSSEIIEILRATAVVMAAGPRILPMPQGNITIPAGATGSTATYGAENADIVATEPTFREVVLQAKKLSAIVPMTNELINDASGNVDAFVRDDLVTAMAERSDLAFLRGDGTANTPVGFLNLVNVANSNAANATVNLQNVTFDLGIAELGLLNNNVPLEGSVWFMAPRTMIFLRDLRDGNGNLAFPSMSNEPPTLRSKRVFSTSQIPINLGGGTDESEVYLVNMRHVLLGETGDMEIDTSQEASYFDGANLQSAFSKDLTLIRTKWRHDIDIRQIFCLSLITAVTWGV